MNCRIILIKARRSGFIWDLLRSSVDLLMDWMWEWEVWGTGEREEDGGRLGKTVGFRGGNQMVWDLKNLRTLLDIRRGS